MLLKSPTRAPKRTAGFLPVYSPYEFSQQARALLAPMVGQNYHFLSRLSLLHPSDVMGVLTLKAGSAIPLLIQSPANIYIAHAAPSAARELVDLLADKLSLPHATVWTTQELAVSMGELWHKRGHAYRLTSDRLHNATFLKSNANVDTSDIPDISELQSAGTLTMSGQVVLPYLRLDRPRHLVVGQVGDVPLSGAIEPLTRLVEGLAYKAQQSGYQLHTVAGKCNKDLAALLQPLQRTRAGGVVHRQMILGQTQFDIAPIVPQMRLNILSEFADLAPSLAWPLVMTQKAAPSIANVIETPSGGLMVRAGGTVAITKRPDDHPLRDAVRELAIGLLDYQGYVWGDRTLVNGVADKWQDLTGRSAIHYGAEAVWEASAFSEHLPFPAKSDCYPLSSTMSPEAAAQALQQGWLNSRGLFIHEEEAKLLLASTQAVFWKPDHQVRGLALYTPLRAGMVVMGQIVAEEKAQLSNLFGAVAQQAQSNAFAQPKLVVAVRDDDLAQQRSLEMRGFRLTNHRLATWHFPAPTGF